MSAVPYRSIDAETETRVLVLAPPVNGNNDDPLIGSLIHVRLETPPVYEALSYVWKNSIIGSLNNIDPDSQAFASVSNDLECGVSAVKGGTKATLKEISQDPLRQWSLWQAGFTRPHGKIRVDGVDVEIGGELHSALKGLRRFWTSTRSQKDRNGYTIWIDALCINQNDIEERNKQVSKMGHVYQRAQAVRIWLGDVVSQTDKEAFNTVETKIGFRF